MTPEAFQQSSLVFMLLEGSHLNVQGHPITNMAVNELLLETVSYAELLVGG